MKNTFLFSFGFTFILSFHASAQLLQGPGGLPCERLNFIPQPSSGYESVQSPHDRGRTLLSEDMGSLHPSLVPLYSKIVKVFSGDQAQRGQGSRRRAEGSEMLTYENFLEKWRAVDSEIPLTQIYQNEEWKKLRATFLPGMRVSFYFRPLDSLVEIAVYESRISPTAVWNESVVDQDTQDEESQFWTTPYLKMIFEGQKLKSAQLTHFLKNGRPRFLTHYGPGGISRRHVDVNPPVISLESIYATCSQEEKTRIERVINNPNRVLVAILDLGLDYNHPAIAFRIPRIPEEVIRSTRRQLELSRGSLEPRQRESLERSISIGWDFRDNDGQPFDFFTHAMNDIDQKYDHGTHVASIVARNHDEIALLPLAHPEGDEEKFYEAVRFAHARGARVMNISLGHAGPDYFKGLDRAMNDFEDMLFVIAAGNESRNLEERAAYPPSYVAKKDNRIIVAAHDSNGKMWSGSNYSPKHVDIAALGVDVLAFRANSLQKLETGTSMATPQVARVAARILSLRPELNPSQVKQIILQTAKPFQDIEERKKIRTGGILDEERALQAARARGLE